MSGLNLTLGTETVTTEEVYDLARKIGRSKAFAYPGVDADDITQELMLAVVESGGELASFEPRALRKVLEAKADRYASAERYRYTMNSGQFVYTPAEVRALFAEAFFDPIAWEDAPRKGDYRLTVNEGGVTVALWDLRSAFDKLRGQECAVIRKRHLGIIQEATGGYVAAVLTDAEQKRYERAIDAVCRFLNRAVVSAATADHDGPGARKAISNAQSIAMTGDNY